MCLHGQDNILEATVSILVKETLFNNILQFELQFVMRNCGIKSLEIERSNSVYRTE